MIGAHFVAIVRDGKSKRRYLRCHTREQALAHAGVVVLEQVNRFGQVVKRERFDRREERA